MKIYWDKGITNLHLKVSYDASWASFWKVHEGERFWWVLDMDFVPNKAYKIMGLAHLKGGH